MPRYIDADALIKNLDDAIQDAKRKNEIGDYWEDDRSNLLYYLDNAPTIDAVEVVRCKDCKHREKYPCDEIEFYECSHLRLYGTKCGVTDDWFCADGERRTDE